MYIKGCEKESSRETDGEREGDSFKMLVKMLMGKIVLVKLISKIVQLIASF
jgi:hypothetical protein